MMRWPPLMAVFLMLAVIAAWPASPSHAISPDEMLADKTLEKRAREISVGLRCLVCQNQSIDDSDAPLARDLRVLVRERLVAGDSDSEVRDFVVARYGEFVLLKPPLSTKTLLLWFMPLLALLGAGAILWTSFRPRPAAEGPLQAATDPGRSLTPDEQARLDALMKNGDDRKP